MVLELVQQVQQQTMQFSLMKELQYLIIIKMPYLIFKLKEEVLVDYFMLTHQLTMLESVQLYL